MPDETLGNTGARKRRPSGDLGPWFRGSLGDAGCRLGPNRGRFVERLLWLCAQRSSGPRRPTTPCRRCSPTKVCRRLGLGRRPKRRAPTPSSRTGRPMTSPPSRCRGSPSAMATSKPSKASRSRSPAARCSPSWGPMGRARPPRSTCCAHSSGPPAAERQWMASTSSASRRLCGVTSASSSRSRPSTTSSLPRRTCVSTPCSTTSRGPRSTSASTESCATWRSRTGDGI